MNELVLLIDDNREMLENAAELLELAGYRVATAENGREGLLKIKENKPDIILCDIIMPALDGYGVLRAIHNQPEYSGIPFVFLTCKTEREDFRRAMDLGADDYLVKPYNGDELLRVVDVRLKKKKRTSVISETGDSAEGMSERVCFKRLAEEMGRLAANRMVRKFKARDVIYMEGDSINSLYYIVSGKVKMFKTNEAGKELITGILNTGEFFGYQALLDELRSNNTVEAIEDTEIALIPQKDFFDLIHNNPDVAIKLMRFISSNYESAEERLLMLAYDSARRKVAEALLMMADKEGKKKQDEICFPVMREDISGIAGISPESVSRNLSDFREEGLIETSGSEIRIVSKEKLEKIKG